MIDFTQESAFVVLEPGIYNATLTKFAFVEHSKSSGKPAGLFTYTITEEPYPGKMASATCAPWMAKKHMIALGCDPTELSGPMTFERFTELGTELVGNNCRLKTSVRHGQNRDGIDADFTQIDDVLSEGM